MFFQDDLWLIFVVIFIQLIAFLIIFSYLFSFFFVIIKLNELIYIYTEKSTFNMLSIVDKEME